MKCCEAHASELRCDYCPWCRIEKLQAALECQYAKVEGALAEKAKLRDAIEEALHNMRSYVPSFGDYWLMTDKDILRMQTAVQEASDE